MLAKPIYFAISNYRKWSSTQYSANRAWTLYWEHGTINTNYKDTSTNNDCARPFSAFQ